MWSMLLLLRLTGALGNSISITPSAIVLGSAGEICDRAEPARLLTKEECSTYASTQGHTFVSVHDEFNSAQGYALRNAMTNKRDRAPGCHLNEGTGTVYYQTGQFNEAGGSDRHTEPSGTFTPLKQVCASYNHGHADPYIMSSGNVKNRGYEDIKADAFFTSTLPLDMSITNYNSWFATTAEKDARNLFIVDRTCENDVISGGELKWHQVRNHVDDSTERRCGIFMVDMPSFHAAFATANTTNPPVVGTHTSALNPNNGAVDTNFKRLFVKVYALTRFQAQLGLYTLLLRLDKTSGTDITATGFHINAWGSTPDVPLPGSYIPGLNVTGDECITNLGANAHPSCQWTGTAGGVYTCTHNNLDYSVECGTCA